MEPGGVAEPGKWLSRGCRGDGAVPGDVTPPGSNAPPARNLGESQRSMRPGQTHEERGDKDTRVVTARRVPRRASFAVP